MPIDVREMVVLHAAMLREIRLGPDAVRRVRAGDQRQARAVKKHLRFVCDLVHAHHDGEDRLLWPLLQKRSTGLDAVDRAQKQHEDIDAAIAQARRLLYVWSDDPTDANADALARQLEVVHGVLGEHFKFEERDLLPIASSELTQAEWNALGDDGAASLPKTSLPLLFGMLMYEGDAAVLAKALEHAPPPARVIVPIIGPKLYARRARQIYGTSTP